MIPKLESNTDNNLEYRPINLLSGLSKVAERVIKNQVFSFIETEKLVVKGQLEFRNNRGT